MLVRLDRGLMYGCAAAAALSGCSLFSNVANDAASNALGAAFATHSTTTTTTTTTPQAAPPPSEPASPPPQNNGAVMAYSPQMAPYYTSYLFTLAFYPTGLALQNVEYKPGQYTRWSFPTSRETKEPSWIERSRLNDDDKGNQWWKVKFHDGGSGETTILEALFSPNQGRLLRLRAKFPGDANGNEMPVDNQAYYMPPRTISAESLAGATVGTEQVTVPAGTFSAKHVVFGGGGHGGTLEWWLSDSVPGGTIKQTAKANHGSDQQEHALMQLEAYGNDAASELGSK